MCVPLSTTQESPSGFRHTSVHPHSLPHPNRTVAPAELGWFASQQPQAKALLRRCPLAVLSQHPIVFSQHPIVFFPASNSSLCPFASLTRQSLKSRVHTLPSAKTPGMLHHIRFDSQFQTQAIVLSPDPDPTIDFQVFLYLELGTMHFHLPHSSFRIKDILKCKRSRRRCRGRKLGSEGRTLAKATQ